MSDIWFKKGLRETYNYQYLDILNHLLLLGVETFVSANMFLIRIIYKQILTLNLCL